MEDYKMDDWYENPLLIEDGDFDDDDDDDDLYDDDDDE